ncbi:MAG TPA: VWA domain-containing protein [Pyrinomonadaceae bacterium]|nr:VWA domain-containing protein [Pyrinomonadaceae bacterium]
MRTQFRKSVKGVATMKSLVAGLLVLTFVSGIIVQGQTPPRSANKTANKPRSETMKICQGVPVPDGYIIIAYMTSAACPHGAYLLKKQDQYEASLAVNGDARQTSTARDTSSTRTKPVISSSTRANSSQARSNSQTKANQEDGAAQATVNGATGGVATRPRRVSGTPAQQPSPPSQSAGQSAGQSPVQSTGQSNAQSPAPTQQIAQTQDSETTLTGPPTLLGTEPARALKPPTLTTMGSSVPNSSSDESAPATAASQPTPEEVDEDDVVRVDTTLVTVPVSVVDRQGRFIPNLKKEDFTLSENGVEQSIAYFEPAEKPFTVALLLDTSASTHFHLSEIRDAAIEFAKQLRPQDRVLVVSFNDEVLLLTEATNDQTLIESAIEVNANTGSSTRLYDAVDLTIRERLNKIKGRKAIVLFTDGVDTSSQQADYLSTLREVEELDALIYPIQYDTTDYLNAMQNAGTVTVVTTRSGIFGTRSSSQTYNVPMNNGGAPLPGATKADYDRADHYLHSLADKTGGRLYQANDTKQLADAFAKIAEELRRQYTLGYYPKKADATDGDRRQIRVKVNQPNVAVKARDSYTKGSAPSPNK